MVHVMNGVNFKDLAVDLRAQLDAQRLRADTAEAEQNDLKKHLAISERHLGRMIEHSDQLEVRLAAAEQRIAEMVAAFTPLLKNWDDLADGESLNVDRARAALNPKPEAGSHES